MDKVFVTNQDEVFDVVTGSDESVERNLSQFFTFFVPDYKFNPLFKAGIWDGKIRLYDRKTSNLYKGLRYQLEEFCNKHNYELVSEKQETTDFSYEEALEFAKSLNLPDWVEIRDYQIKAFQEAVVAGRQTIVSPTSSGKSFIMYLLFRYYNRRTLIIVSKKDLVSQLIEEFKKYGYEDSIHGIYSGQEKNADTQLIISTWQSINQLQDEWFDQFELVMVDETHRAKAKELRSIMEKTKNVSIKFGLTGSMDGKKCHKWVIEGLFGPVRVVRHTHELIEDETLSKLQINCIVLEYPDDYKKSLWKYDDEIDFICGSEMRNDFIVNLINKIPGNNLVLFRYITKHGDILEKKLRELTDRPFYYVHGKSKKELKDNFREIMKKETNAIALVSIDMFGEGTNIPNLNNIFFVHPSKARIKVIQAIGRVLRKTKQKNSAVLYDIADNLAAKKRKNYTMRHFFERLKIYKEQKHPFQIRGFNLKE